MLQFKMSSLVWDFVYYENTINQLNYNTSLTVTLSVHKPWLFWKADVDKESAKRA